jgi:hypothetical protein
MTASVSIHLDRQDAVYHPGETLRGEVEVVSRDAGRLASLTLTLQWQTRGKGEPCAGEARSLLLARDLALSPGAPRRVPFELPAPSGPLTYHGRIVTVEWSVTAVADMGWLSKPRAEARLLLLPFQGEARAALLGYRTAPLQRKAPELDLGPSARSMLGKPRARSLSEEPLWGVAVGVLGILLLLILPSNAWMFGLMLMGGGGMIIANAIRLRALGQSLGNPVLRVHPEIVRAGEPLTVELVLRPPEDQDLEALVLGLSGAELAEKPREAGGEPQRFRHTLHEERRAVEISRRRLRGGKETVIREVLLVPAEAPASFAAPNNEVRWEVTAMARAFGEEPWRSERAILVLPREG